MTAQRCQATTRTGTPCRACARTASDYCFHHDPACAVQRRQARHKGGRARHGRTIGPVGQVEPASLETMADVVTLLNNLINDTLQLENSLQRARTIGYLGHLLMKALEIASLEQRVLALERVLEVPAQSLEDR